MFRQHLRIGERERHNNTDNEGTGPYDERGLHDGTSLWTEGIPDSERSLHGINVGLWPNYICVPTWTDCAARRSHPARSHRSYGSMRLRVPIRHDERIGNISTDETFPSVILPGLAPLEMPGDTQSPAPFTGHGILHRAFGTR